MSETEQVLVRPRASRKVRQGIVISDRMDKTIVVRIDRRVRHPKYGKYVHRSTHLYAHDEENTCRAGDVVQIMETRPLSRLKRWRLLSIVERAK